MDFNEYGDVLKNLIDVPSLYDWFPYEYIDTEVKKKPKEKTVNACGVLKYSKESMLIMLSLMYWGRRVCML